MRTVDDIRGASVNLSRLVHAFFVFGVDIGGDDRARAESDRAAPGLDLNDGRLQVPARLIQQIADHIHRGVAGRVEDGAVRPSLRNLRAEQHDVFGMQLRLEVADVVLARLQRQRGFVVEVLHVVGGDQGGMDRPEMREHQRASADDGDVHEEGREFEALVLALDALRKRLHRGGNAHREGTAGGVVRERRGVAPSGEGLFLHGGAFRMQQQDQDVGFAVFLNVLRRCVNEKTGQIADVSALG